MERKKRKQREEKGSKGKKKEAKGRKNKKKKQSMCKAMLFVGMRVTCTIWQSHRIWLQI
jgi:hypothetical protein